MSDLTVRLRHPLYDIPFNGLNAPTVHAKPFGRTLSSRSGPLIDPGSILSRCSSSISFKASLRSRLRQNTVGPRITAPSGF